MLGGAGNDTYYVDNIGDRVFETTTTTSTTDAGGTDTAPGSIAPGRRLNSAPQKTNSFTDEQRKEYIAGIVERIDVKWLASARQHEMVIHLKNQPSLPPS